MDFNLNYLRNLAAQQEYAVLRLSCLEVLMQGENRHVKILLVLSYAHTGALEEARSLLDEALNQKDLSKIELLDCGSIYLALSNYIDAESIFDELLSQNFEMGSVLAKKAYCRLMFSDFDDAKVFFIRSLEHDGNRVEVLINLCLIELHSFSKVLESNEKNQIFDNIQSYLVSADEKIRHQYHELSQRQYQSLQFQLDAIRFECWVRNKHLMNAEAWLTECLSDEERFVDGVTLYAELLIEHELWFVAEATLLKAAKLLPKIPVFYLKLSKNSEKFGRYSDAIYYASQCELRSIAKQDIQTILTYKKTLIENSTSPFFIDKTVNKKNFCLEGYHFPTIEFQKSHHIRTRFNQAFLNSRNEISLEDECLFLPVFIVGFPFSGISLLEELLLTSEHVASLGSSSNISVAIEAINIRQREIGSSRMYPDNLDELSLEQIKGISLGIQSIYRLKAPDASLIVDRCPDNINHIGMIKCLFPKAKFIYVDRDPRELVLSEAVSIWLDTIDIKTPNRKADHIGQKIIEYRQLLVHWKALFPNDILEVTFNELTKITSAASTDVFSFLGLDLTENTDRYIDRLEVSFLNSTVPDWSKYKEHFAPLLISMSKKVKPLVSDMVTLPSPGLLLEAHDSFKSGNYRAAEYSCKKIIHFLPDYAPAHYLLGEIYLLNGLIELGVASLELAIKIAPWKAPRWTKNLQKAYELLPIKEDIV